MLHHRLTRLKKEKLIMEIFLILFLSQPITCFLFIALLINILLIFVSFIIIKILFAFSSSSQMVPGTWVWENDPNCNKKCEHQQNCAVELFYSWSLLFSCWIHVIGNLLKHNLEKKINCLKMIKELSRFSIYC